MGCCPRWAAQSSNARAAAPAGTCDNVGVRPDRAPRRSPGTGAARPLCRSVVAASSIPRPVSWSRYSWIVRWFGSSCNEERSHASPPMTVSCFVRLRSRCSRSSCTRIATTRPDSWTLISTLSCPTPGCPRRAANTGELRAQLAAKFPVYHAAACFACRNLLPFVQVPPRGLWSRSGQVVGTTARGWPVATSIRPVGGRRDAALPPRVRPGDRAGRGDVVALRGAPRGLRPPPPAAPHLPRRSRSRVLRRDRHPTGRGRRTGTQSALPQYDNLLLSHKDRSRFIPPGLEAISTIWMEQRGFVGSVLVDGMVVGSWQIDDSKPNSRSTLASADDDDHDAVCPGRRCRVRHHLRGGEFPAIRGRGRRPRCALPRGGLIDSCSVGQLLSAGLRSSSARPPCEDNGLPVGLEANAAVEAPRCRVVRFVADLDALCAGLGEQIDAGREDGAARDRVADGRPQCAWARRDLWQSPGRTRTARGPPRRRGGRVPPDRGRVGTAKSERRRGSGSGWFRSALVM